MKQHILLGILMLVLVSTLSHSAPSQHTITGSMGVGVTSPEADLDVDGTIKTDTSVEFADGSTQSTAATPNGNNFRLGTAKYDGVSIDTQNSTPSGITVSPDGTKMFELAANQVYQYSCSKSWNLSSCSYDSISLSMQDTSSRGIVFSTDGKKIYEIGLAFTAIFQYSCTTPWDLSSCSYDTIFMLTQDTKPTGVSVSPDGKKIYEIGVTFNKIYQYSCTTPWDLSSCSYDTINIDTQDTSPSGITTSPDGKRLYETGGNSEKIYQYTCTTPWDLSSCSYDTINIDTQDTSPTEITMSLDGKKIYETGGNSDKIYQYSLGAYIPGRLGIGTDAPDTELDVIGTIQRNNGIFFGYDSAGGTSISNSSWTDITWDTEVREDSAFTHSTDSASITINDNGWYHIETECTGEVITLPTDQRITTTYRIVIDGTEVDGARANSYHRSVPDPRDTASITLLYESTGLSEQIKLQAQIDGGVLETVADGCRIYVERV